MNKVLITGGAGFIGSAVVRQYIGYTDYTIVNVDKLTYAGNLESLADVANHPRHIFEKVDICDKKELERVFTAHKPTSLMHLAAESHVDRSIEGASEFIQTNIVGTYNLLEVSRAYWAGLNGNQKSQFRFHHVSTDEVYGDLDLDAPAFTEETRYAPSSPYAASKASSDHLVRAWHRTYGLPVIITNCSNNYGPYQFPEKLIPLMIINAVEGRPLPVYGKGENIRDWLYVEDHANALRKVLDLGVIGETYNIGGACEKSNIEVVNAVCAELDKIRPDENGPYARLIELVADRPGHDKRYAIDQSKIAYELGWLPNESFESGLRRTISWYLDNDSWLTNVRSGEYTQWIEKNYSSRQLNRKLL